jgi:hypothetical protein
MGQLEMWGGVLMDVRCTWVKRKSVEGRGVEVERRCACAGESAIVHEGPRRLFSGTNDFASTSRCCLSQDLMFAIQGFAKHLFLDPDYIRAQSWYRSQAEPTKHPLYSPATKEQSQDETQ